jgi:hypothetical protein
MSLSLCRSDGALFAIKGAKAGEEVDELNRVGGFASVVRVLIDAAGEAATVVEVRRAPNHGRKAP